MSEMGGSERLQLERAGEADVFVVLFDVVVVMMLQGSARLLVQVERGVVVGVFVAPALCCRSWDHETRPCGRLEIPSAVSWDRRTAHRWVRRTPRKLNGWMHCAASGRAGRTGRTWSQLEQRKERGKEEGKR